MQILAQIVFSQELHYGYFSLKLRNELAQIALVIYAS
jgi:hypothetical protein